jgi:NhaP-type Na+/H+ or K+/H+ antiporter
MQVAEGIIVAEERLVGIAIILVLGAGVQWLGWRFKLPAILLLLTAGFLVGPVAHVINPDFIFGGLLFPLVSLAVALILFEGGLSLRLADLKQVGNILWRLLTIGMLATWSISTLAAHYFIGLSWSLALLLGSILVVTGPTVIGPLLAFVRPKDRIGSLLRWEGIAIDPLGAVLTVLVFEALALGRADNAPLFIIAGLLKTFLVGSACGLLGAAVIILLLYRYWVPDFLQNFAVLAMVWGGFALSNYFQAESGLLAVTVMGIVLANQRWLSIRHIVEFKENLRVMMVSVLFVVLSAKMNLGDFQYLGWGALAFFLILVLAARPLSIVLSCLGTKITWREQAFMAWMAPRGVVAASVSAIFALRLQQANVPQSEILAPVTIIIVFGTVLLYGLTTYPLARKLDVAKPDPRGLLIAGAHSWARRFAMELKNLSLPVLLVDTNRSNAAQARMQKLPAKNLSVLSREVWQQAQLGELGFLLALTPSDELNALACVRFIELFGRAKVFQLTPEEEEDSRKASVTEDHKGRLLFTPQLTYNGLSRVFAFGGGLEKVAFEDEAQYENYLKRNSQMRIPLFVYYSTGEIEIYAASSPTTPSPPCEVIFLTIPEEVRDDWNYKAAETVIAKKNAKSAAMPKNKQPARTET